MQSKKSIDYANVIIPPKKKHYHKFSIHLAQKLVNLCCDLPFQSYCFNVLDAPTISNGSAIHAVCKACKVSSRSEILENPIAIHRLAILIENFQQWKLTYTIP